MKACSNTQTKTGPFSPHWLAATCSKIHFVMKDSIEERMATVQESKDDLGKGALHNIAQQERMKAKFTFLRDLFDITEQMSFGTRILLTVLAIVDCCVYEDKNVT
jgi:hypothetical protein